MQTKNFSELLCSTLSPYIGEGGDQEESASRQALHRILDKMAEGAFQPGKPIRESTLAREFQLNRAAVREALNLIVGWDILEYTSNCGFRVRNFSLQDILSWCELREGLEPIAARRLSRLRPPAVLDALGENIRAFEEAMKGSDDRLQTLLDLQFHVLVMQGSGNRLFRHMQLVSNYVLLFFFRHGESLDLQFLGQHLRRSGVVHLRNRAEVGQIINNETLKMHQRMFEAIQEGEEEQAEFLFREHLAWLRQSVEREIAYMQ